MISRRFREILESLGSFLVDREDRKRIDYARSLIAINLDESLAIFFFNSSRINYYKKNCLIFVFRLEVFDNAMSAPCCSPLRSCSHYNRADPTVPQRVIVSENERGRGLHVGSVSSRTSNTHQRTAPRRYVQKWRSSCSTARRRRRSPSPTFSNVITSRSIWWSREAPVRGRANVNIPVRIPCVPTSCVWLRRRLDVCACISVVICDDDISSG